MYHSVLVSIDLNRFLPSCRILHSAWRFLVVLLFTMKHSGRCEWKRKLFLVHSRKAYVAPHLFCHLQVLKKSSYSDELAYPRSLSAIAQSQWASSIPSTPADTDTPGRAVPSRDASHGALGGLAGFERADAFKAGYTETYCVAQAGLQGGW